MAEVVIPEVKHEYIRQVDTTETKDTWFDECIADNKEAAWAGIGTSENDSQYQPAPSIEPDYYMQYCSSDDYDYLKDYRLIWGYGIGIIEQDVICSLSTGEHLAEGVEACDAYETENAAGKDVDWKRGVWLKFSGNRNNSPARIGEVILPEYIISLKDLCAVLTPTNGCVFEMFNSVRGVDVVTHILNISNLCGQKNITVTPNDNYYQADFFPLDVSYAFANATITGFDDPLGFWYIFQNAVNGNHCFYNANLTVAMGDLNYFGRIENGNYESAFEGCTITATTGEEINYTGVVNKATFKNCNADLIMPTMAKLIGDCESAFEGCTINHTGSRNGDTDDDIDWNSLDFSKVTNAKRMFYNTSWVENEIFLDLSSIVEHEDGCFDNFFKSNDSHKTINIKAPDTKIKGYEVFNLSLFTINILNELKCYDLWDDNIKCDYKTTDEDNSYCFIYGYQNTINGIIVGINIFEYRNGLPILNANSNLTIKTSKRPDNITIKSIIEKYNTYRFFPCIFISANIIAINSLWNYVNIDDYYPVNSILSGTYLNNINITNNVIKSVNKKGKEFCIITDNIQGLYLNIETDDNSGCCIGYNNGYSNNNNRTIELNNVDNIHHDYVSINHNGNDKLPITIYKSIRTLCKRKDGNYVYCLYNFNNCKAIIDNDYIINMSNSNWCYLNFDYIDELYIGNINLQKTSSYDLHINLYGNIVNTLINDYENNYLDGLGINKYSLLTLYIKEIKNIETNKTTLPLCTIDKFNYEDEVNNIEYPNILNVTNIDNIGVIGKFKNTPLSHLNKRYYKLRKGSIVCDVSLFSEENYINDIEDFDYNYNKALYGFSIYGDYTDKMIKFNYYTNGSYIGYTLTSRNEKISNLTTEINGVGTSYSNINGNLTINFPNTYNTNVSIKENCNIDNLTLNLNDRGFADGFGLSFYSYNDSITINNIFINTTGGKITIDTDYKLFNNLSQDSINSIVNPNIYKGGITVTINTIPFQYITEEQKQALVDAGVTLVEYIPTETTE